MSGMFGTTPRGAGGKFAPRLVNTRKNPLVKSQKKRTPVKQTACISVAPIVSSPQLPDEPATTLRSPETPATNKGQNMKLDFTRSNTTRKDDRLVIFNFADGRAGSVQFLRSAFGETVPNAISMEGDFAEKTAKAEKVKETPEERKARLAALPKPTLADRVKKAEEKAAKLRAKLAKDQAPQEASL